MSVEVLTHLEVGDVDEAGVLVHVHHVGVEAGEVEDVLGEAGEGQLQREHLPKGPVVCGGLEGGQGPLLQQVLRHHLLLHVS